jgi:hypothetical protein
MNEAFANLPAATGIVPNDHVEVGRTPTRVAVDPHSARLALDHVEWFDRLVRLAELRESGLRAGSHTSGASARFD